MEENEKACVTTDEEPKLHYRGWKSMPFVIGKKRDSIWFVLVDTFLFFFFFVCDVYSSSLLILMHILNFAGNETFEKLGTTGTSSNLLIYFTTVFNMKSITATTLINIFNGTTNFATLLGAFLCDTYFGRYKTLGFASVASFLVL